MKKFLALIALVAMVAASSVVSAVGPSAAPVTASVNMGDVLSIDSTHVANTYSACNANLTISALVPPAAGTAECSFALDANVAFDLYVVADTGLKPVGMNPTTILYVPMGGENLSGYTADQYWAGYYVKNIDARNNLGPSACNANTVVCKPGLLPTKAYTAKSVVVGVEEMALGLAVAIDVIQPDSYSDVWTLTAAAS